MTYAEMLALFDELQEQVYNDLQRLETLDPETEEFTTLADKCKQSQAKQLELGQKIDVANARKTEIETLRSQHSAFAQSGNMGGARTGRDGKPIGGPVPAGHVQFGAMTREGVRPIIDDTGLGWVSRKQLSSISTEAYKDAYRRYLCVGFEQLGRDDRWTLSEGSDSAGTYLVPIETLNRLSQRKPAPTRIYGKCQQFNTSALKLTIPQTRQGDDIYPTGYRVTLSGDSNQTTTAPTSPGGDESLFGSVEVPVYEALIRGGMSRSFVEDAAFDPLEWVTNQFGTTVELTYDSFCVNGGATGKSEPFGFNRLPGAVGEPSIVLGGHATDITQNGLEAIRYAIPEQYDENCTWIFNKTQTALKIRQIRDSTGRTLFAFGVDDSGMATLQSRLLLEYPYMYSAFMPNPTQNSFPIFCGDLNGMAFVRRVGFSLQVMRDSYYDKDGLIGIHGRCRFGSRVLEPWRMRVLKIAAS